MGRCRKSREFRLRLENEAQTMDPATLLQRIGTIAGRAWSIYPASNEVTDRAALGQPMCNRTWQEALDSGRSYMAGSQTPEKDYIRRYRGSTVTWHRMACWWAWRSPECALRATCEWPSLNYHIYRRGEYVEIRLPHHDAGGEKTWITQAPFRSKILIDVD